MLSFSGDHTQRDTLSLKAPTEGRQASMFRGVYAASATDLDLGTHEHVDST